jgi:hypothetical protein
MVRVKIETVMNRIAFFGTTLPNLFITGPNALPEPGMAAGSLNP